MYTHIITAMYTSILCVCVCVRTHTHTHTNTHTHMDMYTHTFADLNWRPIPSWCHQQVPSYGSLWLLDTCRGQNHGLCTIPKDSTFLKMFIYDKCMYTYILTSICPGSHTHTHPPEGVI